VLKTEDNNSLGDDYQAEQKHVLPASNQLRHCNALIKTMLILYSAQHGLSPLILDYLLGRVILAHHSDFSLMVRHSFGAS
jgi:hypothetical protein